MLLFSIKSRVLDHYDWSGEDQNSKFILDMVVHAYNSSSQRLRQEDLEFKVNLGYIARSCLRKQKNPKQFNI
jgi:hypothetical protein